MTVPPAAQGPRVDAIPGLPAAPTPAATPLAAASSPASPPAAVAAAAARPATTDPAADPTGEPTPPAPPPALPDRASVALFDLDGTISESGAIIVATLRATLAEMGLPGFDDEVARLVVGPPLGQTLERLIGVPATEVPAVIARYRANLRPALTRTPAYDGMIGLIRELHAAGLPMAVATSKVTSSAVPIVDAYGLLDCFVAVCGSGPDELTGTKATVVAAALAALADAGCDLSRPVMVGDRHHDVEGAAVHGVPTIAVRWGYGSPAEWAQAGALADTPDHLRDLLLGDSSA